MQSNKWWNNKERSFAVVFSQLMQTRGLAARLKGQSADRQGLKGHKRAAKKQQIHL